MSTHTQTNTTVEPVAPDLLTITEAAALARLSKSTLRRYVAAGTFPAPVLQGPANAASGGQLQRWWRHEILAYLEGLKRGGGKK